jgi:hypothetical protein
MASELGREKWGGIVVSRNGVWKMLRRRGLNTRQAARADRRLRRAYESPRDPGPGPHIEVDRRASWSLGTASPSGACAAPTARFRQLTAIDVYSSYASAELVICKQGNPTAKRTRALARRVARELKAAGWRLERVLSDNGNEFRGQPSTPPARASTRATAASAPAARRPTVTSRRLMTAFTTAASPATASPQTSSTVPTRWRRDEPNLPAHLGVGPTQLPPTLMPGEPFPPLSTIVAPLGAALIASIRARAGDRL